jgi:hypothetical protein
MNTAVPATNGVTPDGLDAVQRQGAGMIHVDSAILAGMRVEPAALELGESSGGPAKCKLSIQNLADHSVTVQVSHAPALATGPDTFTPVLETAQATATFSATAIRIPRGGKGKLDVTIAPDPGLATGTLFGGYIVFTPDDGGREVRVPYVGYAGDYQSLPAMTPTTFGLPWLCRLVNGVAVNQPDGATFTLAGDDVPNILLHLDRPVSELEMEVFDAGTGRDWHRMFFARDYSRNVGAVGATAYPWNGTTQHGKKLVQVPNGRYVVKVTVLKPLGNPHHAGDLETWTSPVITLARPATAVIAATNDDAEITTPGLPDPATPRAELALATGSPNPFATAVALRFSLPAAGTAALEIFDPQGRCVRAWRWNGLPAGDHTVAWDGRGDDGRPASAGLLLMRLTTPAGTLTRKLVRVR